MQTRFNSTEQLAKGVMDARKFGLVFRFTTAHSLLLPARNENLFCHRALLCFLSRLVAAESHGVSVAAPSQECGFQSSDPKRVVLGSSRPHRYKIALLIYVRMDDLWQKAPTHLSATIVAKNSAEIRWRSGDHTRHKNEKQAWLA